MKKSYITSLIVMLIAFLVTIICVNFSYARVRVVKNRRVTYVSKLPRGYVKVVVRSKPYYYHSGVFYSKGPKGYIRIAAPVGARITALPKLSVRVVIGGVPYWNYFGTYYRYDRSKREYIVVERPAEEPVEELTADKIVLVDGDTLYGRYLGGDEDIIKFNNNGEILEIPVVDVVSIAFEPLPAVEEEQ